MTELAVFTDARAEFGLSLKAIAGSVGCTTECLYKWRVGTAKVPQHKWQSLMRAYGVDPERYSRETYLQQFAARNRDPETAPETQQAPPEAQNAPKAPEPPIEAPSAPEQPHAPKAAGWLSWLTEDDPIEA